MILGLMENRFDGNCIEKPCLRLLLQSLKAPSYFSPLTRLQREVNILPAVFEPPLKFMLPGRGRSGDSGTQLSQLG